MLPDRGNAGKIGDVWKVLCLGWHMIAVLLIRNSSYVNVYCLVLKCFLHAVCSGEGSFLDVAAAVGNAQLTDFC